MKSTSILFVLYMAINAFGESPTNSPSKDSWRPDELFSRTGIFLDGIPAELPEDKVYPVTNNLHKLDAYQRSYGIHLETRDLPRFERAYREWGVSDGIFNVPEWISIKDEWDGGTLYRQVKYKVARRNENGDVVPLSRRDITWNRICSRPYFKFTPIRSFYTLGQLSKMCDGVFIGTIINTQYQHLEDGKSVVKHDGRRVDMSLTFRVGTNFLGKISGDILTIPIDWMENKECAPTNGMRLLVFYVNRVWTNAVMTLTLDRQMCRFDWEKPPRTNDATPSSFGRFSSNARILNSPETEKTYIEVITHYLLLLRNEKRDPNKYYDFLCSLVKSPVLEIRQDAKEDLLWFWGPFGPDGFDLEHVLDDPKLDWNLGKDYVRYIAIPDRDKRKTKINETK